MIFFLGGGGVLSQSGLAWTDCDPDLLLYVLILLYKSKEFKPTEVLMKIKGHCSVRNVLKFNLEGGGKK